MSTAMRCHKCGYDFSGSGDTAHVCTGVPLDTVLRNAILRSAKVVEPKREWVGLTKHDIREILESNDWTTIPARLIWEAEAKLKEKNT